MGLQIGAVLRRRYRVVGRLGEGGMGSVYKVEDQTRPGVYFALKELLDDSTASPEDTEWARKHFDAEIALMRHLRHARIPRFEASFTEGTARYFLMEYIPGENLDERLTRTHGPLPEADVLRWMTQICDVLAYLHHRQPPIIVRDLKPSNIMVTPSGEARLIDFGIARTYKPGQASNTENLGTMLYASPEHLGHSQTDARSDIYSLGATMFHLLTNHEPVPMETPAPGTLQRLVPSISEKTDRIVVRAMQLDSALRFQSAKECQAALQQALSAQQPARSPQNRAQARRSTPSRTAVIPASAPVSVKRSAPASGPAQLEDVVCPHCGFVNRAGAKYCAQDGARLTSASIDGTAAAQQRPSAPYAITGTYEQRGAEAFAAGQFAQAARLAEAAIASGHARYEQYMLLGHSRQKQERPLEAAQAFERAAELRATSEALVALGEAYTAAHLADQALIAYTRARHVAPDDALIASRLSACSLELGLLSQAEGEARSALQLRPGFPPALVALGRIAEARHQLETAVALFRQAITEDPGSVDAHLELGRTLLAQHKPAEALKSLQQARALAPARAETHSVLAICYHAIGQRTHARDELREAVRLNPTDTESRELLRQL